MAVVIVGCAFGTSLLSGVFGMGGGMILMGALLLLLPLSLAMVLHGSAQLVSNGGRAWLLRRHIRWRVLPGYLAGAATGLGLFALLALEVDVAVAMVVLGTMPLAMVLMPKWPMPSIMRHRGAFLCGVLVSMAQLVIGVSGPLLDMFFLAGGEDDLKMDRYAIIATKALTQTIGHSLKIVYFGALIEKGGAPPLLFAAVIIATLLGTRTGTRLLARLEDRRFQRYSRVLLVGIGAVYLVRGAAIW